jgi:imidazolonepropionase-like amidohydrolase
MLIRLCTLTVTLALTPVWLWAQPETGTFRLHKFAQAIGEETYTIAHESGGLTLQATFSFTDRGTPVPLKATLHADADYTPRSFAIGGMTSRHSSVDAEVTIGDGRARVRDGKQTNEIPAPQSFFTIAGYSPVALEMALLRYWRAHGRPARLAILPSGLVEIRDRGPETLTVNGRRLELERYSVKGLVWGLETLWMDRDDRLAALVTRDAEFDHFEAVQSGLEPALTTFIVSAARDEMAELQELGRSLPGRRAGTMALTGATLIDGTGTQPITHATIVTGNGRILAAGPAAAVIIPDGAMRIDVTGKYVIPGLWDMHAHYEQVEWGPIYLAAGVTTVRDVGNELEFITAVRDAINSGQGIGPHMLLAGIVDGDGPMALGVTRVNSADDAKTWVRKYHDAGFQQIKIYSSVMPENVAAICTQAHAVGMTVTGHVPEGMDIYEAVKAGMDQVDHIQYLAAPLRPATFDRKTATFAQRMTIAAAADIRSPAGQQLIAFLKDHHTVIDDTVALFELIAHPASQAAVTIEPGIAKVAPELREQLTTAGVPPEFNDAARQTIRRYLEILGALHDAGVPVVAGTDQSVPGSSVYRELELYVEAGFTPMEALQAATIVPARVMKLADEAGTVEAGKRADLAILDRNPLEDIHHIRSVRSVVANGVLYDSAPLWTSAGFTP